MLVIALVGVQHAAPLRGQTVQAQTASAEALFEAGALRAAADSFAARATRDPQDPAHWYNLGATLYRAGADGKATAAWIRAARLAPRDQAIRRDRPETRRTARRARRRHCCPGVRFWLAAAMVPGAKCPARTAFTGGCWPRRSSDCERRRARARAAAGRARRGSDRRRRSGRATWLRRQRAG